MCVSKRLIPINQTGRERVDACMHVTTGDKKFAVCLLHTAKSILPTAKTLPCATHGKDHTANKHRLQQ